MRRGWKVDRIVRVVVGALAGVAALAASAAPAGAQTFNWTNAAGGTFGTNTNWSPLGPPSTQSHTAVFNVSNGNYAVSLGANHNVGTLIVGSSQFSLTINTFGRNLGTVFRQSYASIAGVTINGGGIYGGIQSTTDVRGILNVGTATLFRTSSLLVGTPAGSGAVTINSGTINTLGAVVGREGFSGGLTLSNGSVGSLSFIDVGQPGLPGAGNLNVLTNSSLFVGTIQLGAQGTFVTGSGMTVSGGGRVTMYPDSPLIVGGSTIGVTVSFPNIILNRTGILNITSNSSTFSPGTPGTFTTSAAPVTVNYGGAINVSNGTFNVNGDVLTNGAVTVGAQGNYLQLPTGTTRVEGTTLGAGASSISLTGAAPSFVGNGTVTGGTLIVGSAPGTDGWATLFSNSSINFSTATIVGEAGTGRLDAATLNTPSLTVGHLAGGIGTFSAGIYDTGSASLDRSGTPVVGSVIAGNLGTGVLQVRLGSTMTVNGPTDVGLGAGSAGTILVAGTSAGTIATYTAPGQRMTIGSTGAGTLLVGPFALVDVGTLTVGPAVGPGAGTVIQSGGTVDPGTIVLNPRGTYVLNDGTLAAPIVNAGTFIYGGGTFQGVLENGNTLFLNAPLPSGSVVQNAPAGRINAANGLFSGNGTISNAGTFGGAGTLAAGMTLINAGTISSAGGEFVIENGATFTSTAGSLMRNAPASTLRIRTHIDYLGSVEVNAGGAVETLGALNIHNAQRLALKGGLLAVGNEIAGNNLTIFPGGSVVGFGQINASMYNVGSVQFNGPTQILGLLDNNAAIGVRNATTIVYGPMTNNGSITVQNGTIVFEQAFLRGTRGGSGGGFVGGTGALSVQAGGRFVADAVRQESLQFLGTAASPAFGFIRPAADGGQTSVVNALSIAGFPGNYHSQLDLADNALAIDYPAGNDPPLLSVLGYLSTGYAGGAWNGNGIASSAAAVVPGRAIGLADASEVFTSFPATFAGVTVDATSLLLRHTLAGDANLDRAVTIADFSVLAANFNQQAYWARGDFNYDLTTGIADFALLAANFNQSLPAEVARTPLPTPHGPTVALGWTTEYLDVAASIDTGLAMGFGEPIADNFGVAAIPEPSVALPVAAGIALFHIRRRKLATV